MNSLSMLDTVTKDLEQHENSIRIKKLIFAACWNTWENDSNKLGAFKLSDLVQKLVQSNPTLEQLAVTLNKLVQTLNKPGEYAIIAFIILGKVEKLYQNNPEVTQVGSNAGSAVAAPAPAIKQQPSTQSIAAEQKPPYDPFELRLEVMRYTNPLRAKILIFSTLYQQLDINEKELAVIRSHELDDLLKDLFLFCQTISELEARLSSTARCLFEQDENSQAASAIVQALKPSYANRTPGMYQMPQLNSHKSTQEKEIVNLNQSRPINQNKNEVDDNTCQVNK